MGTPWEKYFTWANNPYYGYVETIEDANRIIDEFSSVTQTTYIVSRNTKYFGSFVWGTDENSHAIRFSDDGKITHGSQIQLDGIPFIVLGSKLMECHQGIHRNHYKYPKRSDKSQNRRSVGSKKMGCTASVYLREVIIFPEYKPLKDSSHYRRIMSRKLHLDLELMGDQTDHEKRIYIDLPPRSKHMNHIMGDAADIKAPINRRISAYLYPIIESGVTDIKKLKEYNQEFVQKHFKDHTLPRPINRRFYLSDEVLKQMVHRRRKVNRQPNIDQVKLQELIEQKIKENSDNVWLFRRSGDENESNTAAADLSKELCDKLLLVHQASWQQRLLCRYGQQLVFLDAVHKMTDFFKPLYFLVVNTNDGYMVVGFMVVEKDDSSSLAEALAVIQQYNPEWNPQAFMTSSLDIQLPAIAAVFPDAEVFISDFHRKQAWQNFTDLEANGLEDSKDKVLKLLNAVAETITEEEYGQRVNQLEASNEWLENPSLRSYIHNHWLDSEIYKRWVWAFQLNYRMVVCVSGGVDAQSKFFKYEDLETCKIPSLTVMVKHLLSEFFPESYRKYMSSNITMSQGWRVGRTDVPTDMQYRPHHLIRHMRDREVRAGTRFSANMVERCSDKIFTVTSHKEKYNVSLGDDVFLPMCECRQFAITRLPCVHFAAVFMHFKDVTFESLSPFYKYNVLFVTDKDCLNSDSNVEEDITPEEEETQTRGQILIKTEPRDNTISAQVVSRRDSPAKLERAGQRLDCSSKDCRSQLQAWKRHQSGKKCRELLRKLDNQTYACESTEELEKTALLLDVIYKNLMKSCKSTAPLVVGEIEQRDVQKPLGRPRKKKKVPTATLR